jgi:hypothetical protein
MRARLEINSIGQLFKAAYIVLLILVKMYIFLLAHTKWGQKLYDFHTLQHLLLDNQHVL